MDKRLKTTVLVCTNLNTSKHPKDLQLLQVNLQQGHQLLFYFPHTLFKSNHQWSCSEVSPLQLSFLLSQKVSNFLNCHIFIAFSRNYIFCSWHCSLEFEGMFLLFLSATRRYIFLLMDRGVQENAQVNWESIISMHAISQSPCSRITPTRHLSSQTFNYSNKYLMNQQFSSALV